MKTFTTSTTIDEIGDLTIHYGLIATKGNKYQDQAIDELSNSIKLEDTK